MDEKRIDKFITSNCQCSSLRKDEIELIRELFTKKIDGRLSKAKNLDIVTTIHPNLPKAGKVGRSYMSDSFGKRLLGMKLSEAIEMFEGFKKEYGDLEIQKMSYVNMGLCLVSHRPETYAEKEIRISDRLFQEIAEKILEERSRTEEINRLREKIKKLTNKDCYSRVR